MKGWVPPVPGPFGTSGPRGHSLPSRPHYVCPHPNTGLAGPLECGREGSPGRRDAPDVTPACFSTSFADPGKREASGAGEAAVPSTLGHWPASRRPAHQHGAEEGGWSVMAARSAERGARPRPA